MRRRAEENGEGDRGWVLNGLRSTGRHTESGLRRLLGVFKAFSVTIDPSGAIGFGVDVDPIRGVADSGRFAEDLSALLGVLGRQPGI